VEAIILAAGQGTRLRPYTLDRPKCMVEVCGHPLLATQLHVMRMCGVEKITLVGGYLSDKLPDETVTSLVLNPEYVETNMVWTLRHAAADMGDDVIVSYGDIIFPPHVLQKLMESDADFSVAIDADWEKYWSQRFDDVLDDAETLRLDASGSITEIGKKPEDLSQIQGQYIGLMRFSGNGANVLRTFLSNLSKDSLIESRPAGNAYMTDLLQHLIHHGHDVKSVQFTGDWCEVDSPEDFELANKRAAAWVRELGMEGAN